MEIAERIKDPEAMAFANLGLSRVAFESGDYRQIFRDKERLRFFTYWDITSFTSQAGIKETRHYTRLEREVFQEDCSGQADFRCPQIDEFCVGGVAGRDQFDTQCLIYSFMANGANALITTAFPFLPWNPGSSIT